MNPIDAFKKECPISGRIARNRFLAQPCEHNHAKTDGSFSDPLLDFYRRMKAGNWGVIVLETTATSSREKCRERELVLSDEAKNKESWKNFFKEMKKMTNEKLQETLYGYFKSPRRVIRMFQGLEARFSMVNGNFPMDLFCQQTSSTRMWMNMFMRLVSRMNEGLTALISNSATGILQGSF